MLMSSFAGAAESEVAQLLREVAELRARVARVEARNKKALASVSRAPATESAGAKAKGKAAAASPAGTSEGGGDEKVLTANLDELKATKLTLKEISDAFAVPDSPAAGALGLPQKNVQHLDTPKQLVAAAINGLDENGNFQSGLSVDFAPAQWIWGARPVDDFRYQREATFGDSSAVWFRRVLARTQISFASTKGASDDDKSSKLALGLHIVLVNGNDALSNAPATVLRDSVNGKEVVSGEDHRVLDARGRKLNQWVIGSSDKPERDRFFTTRGLWQDVGEFLYSHASWAVGAAPHWIAADGEDSYEFAGATYWSSFALIPSREFPARLLFNVLYKQGEDVAGATAIELPAPAAPGLAAGAVPATIDQDSLFIAGGVQVGNVDFNATFTAAYVQLDQGKFGDETSFRYAASLEKRVSTNSWLTLTVSRDEGRQEGENETLVLGGVKIGLGGRDFTADEQRIRAEQFAHD